jgi:hypothetical protein
VIYGEYGNDFLMGGAGNARLLVATPMTRWTVVWATAI